VPNFLAKVGGVNSNPLNGQSKLRYRANIATLQTLPVDGAKLSDFCCRWKISRLELFGSARFDWNAARDVDLAVR
jgi:hypothetical protein